VQHAKVGQTGEVRVVNRVGPKLCLFTSEAEGVLHFSSRVLPMGVSRIPLKMEVLHAPNFAYSVTMVDKKNLHQATKEFTVSVPMNLSLRMDKKVYLPGEKIAIDLQVKGQEGRPVEGEFCLSAVDASVLERFPDLTPKLYEEFFSTSMRRSMRVLTSSSCSFFFAPEVRDVDSNLRLEEVEKRARPIKYWGVVSEEGLSVTGGKGGGKIYTGPGNLKIKDLEEAPESFDVVAIGGGASGHFGGQRGGRRVVAGQLGLGGRPVGFFYEDGLDALESGSGLNRDGKGLDAILERNLRQVEGDVVRPMDLSVWRVSIRSDKRGRAHVILDLPKRVGKWELRIRGVDKGSLFGDQSEGIVTRNPMVVRGRIPVHLTQGDEVKGEVEVHNLDEQTFSGNLIQKIDGQELERSKVVLKAGGLFSRSLALPTSKAGMHSFLFRTSASVDRGFFRVHPWALKDEVWDGGVFAGGRTAKLSLGKEAHRNRVLQIHVYPPSRDTVAKAFVVLGEGRRFLLARDRIGVGLGALALFRELGGEAGRKGGFLALESIETEADPNGAGGAG